MNSETDWTVIHQNALELSDWVTAEMLDTSYEELGNMFRMASELKTEPNEVSIEALRLFEESRVKPSKVTIISQNKYWEFKCKCGNRITWGEWIGNNEWVLRSKQLSWCVRTCRCQNRYKLDTETDLVTNF